LKSPERNPSSQIVVDDDNTPIRVDTKEQRNAVLDFCWLRQGLYEELCK